VVALGGANLLTAFNGAMVAAIAPINSVVVPLVTPSNLPPAATPTSSNRPDNKADVGNSGETPAQPENIGINIDSHNTITHVGTLTLVNGGVKLPSDMKGRGEDNRKSDNKNSDRKNRANGSDENNE
jgi:hypothetical protein